MEELCEARRQRTELLLSYLHPGGLAEGPR